MLVEDFQIFFEIFSRSQQACRFLQAASDMQNCLLCSCDIAKYTCELQAISLYKDKRNKSIQSYITEKRNEFMQYYK